MRKLLALLLLAPALAAAQAWPTRPITIIVPFPPGSGTDLIPRAMAPVVSQALGQPVVVENRPGAAGNVGAAQVARAEPDGYTLLSVPTGVLAINQWLYKDIQFNAVKDFAPVINAGSTPNLIVAHPSLGAANLKELIARAKAKPGSISYASGGSGTTSHLCGEAMKVSAGLEMVHVPYKGPAAAHQDLLSGRVPLMCDNLSNVLPHVRSGKLRGLALAARERHPQAPDIPTAAESGMPGLDVGVWYGIVAPAGTPQPVIARLNAEFAKALKTPAVAERLQSLGLTIIADTPEQFARFATAEAARWRKIVQDSGAKLD